MGTVIGIVAEQRMIGNKIISIDVIDVAVAIIIDIIGVGFESVFSIALTAFVNFALFVLIEASAIRSR